jgi:hypothetical protein
MNSQKTRNQPRLPPAPASQIPLLPKQKVAKGFAAQSSRGTDEDHFRKYYLPAQT